MCKKAEERVISSHSVPSKPLASLVEREDRLQSRNSKMRISASLVMMITLSLLIAASLGLPSDPKSDVEIVQPRGEKLDGNGRMGEKKKGGKKGGKCG